MQLYVLVAVLVLVLALHLISVCVHRVLLDEIVKMVGSCNDTITVIIMHFKKIDINECESTERLCEQLCTNTQGSYFCTCHDGFIIGNDGDRCVGKFFTHHNYDSNGISILILILKVILQIHSLSRYCQHVSCLYKFFSDTNTVL